MPTRWLGWRQTLPRDQFNRQGFQFLWHVAVVESFASVLCGEVPEAGTIVMRYFGERPTGTPCVECLRLLQKQERSERKSRLQRLRKTLSVVL